MTLEGLGARSLRWRRAVAMLACLTCVVASAETAGLRQAQPPDSTASITKRAIPYSDAAPVLASSIDRPPEPAGKPMAELESIWPQWVASHDAAIRGRLDRGDEDSIVNLWMSGTTFTRRPPARGHDLESLGGPTEITELLQDRLEDLLVALVSPGRKERVTFARQFFERRGINPATRAGKDRIRQELIAARERVLNEFARTDQELQAARRLGDRAAELAAQASIFASRGLSSDTSILPDFGIERTLEVLKAATVLQPGSVRRVAVVGPGLDFINKANGHDFYPEQTLQPFALIDSLRRLGLATSDLRLTTFDLSPRVNDHLQAARQRAAAGRSYTIHVLLSRTERWTSELKLYWQRLGNEIGEETTAAASPGGVNVRAVRVRPEIVQAIVPRDLNIVIERLDPLADDEHFDLVVATNIFVYYGEFEQALAVVNIARMLRPGGLLLANASLVTPPPMRPSVGYLDVLYSDRQYDHMFSYQRQ